MFIGNTDFRILKHTTPISQASSHIPRTYDVSTTCFCMIVVIYDELRSNIVGFTETLAFIRLIGTGALSRSLSLWSRSKRTSSSTPFGSFRQPKLSVLGPYTDCNLSARESECKAPTGRPKRGCNMCMIRYIMEDPTGRLDVCCLEPSHCSRVHSLVL